MIITAKQVLELNEEHCLIENLSKRARSNPEGVGFDIRVESVYEPEGSGFIGAPHPKIVDAERVEEDAEFEEHQILKKLPDRDQYLVEVEVREQPTAKRIAGLNQSDQDDHQQTITLAPGQRVLIQTIEKVNVPPADIDQSTTAKIKPTKNSDPCYVVPVVFPRSTLFRSGVSFESSKTDPGYSGKLTFALTNHGSDPFVFELGARVANIVFMATVGDIQREYGGQQEGRVTSDDAEYQN